MTDIIIVGAGTAGMSAAIYGLRAGKSVLVFEATAYGGQIINTPDIENYPGIAHVSGFDFATGLYNQMMDLGAELKFERVTSVEDAGDKKIVRTANGEYEAKAVILATGAKNRPLGLEREQEMIGSGVSYCATCDGMFFRKKDVVVNGGGNTALEDAAFLANYCNKVYLVHRRDAFRGDAAAVKELESKENVEFVLNANVTKILGDKKVEGVEVTDKLTGEKRVIEAQGLFVAIGQMPENAAFQNLVDLDAGGYIAAGEDCLTKTSGIYTAGDCRTKTVRQLTTAAADGAVAALAAASGIK
ncbi:MAG: FAD-dependent oxidoreductase [Eubacterium sp.]|nr:FAD-dependent oxidoreductase [Eubacterium sp.]